MQLRFLENVCEGNRDSCVCTQSWLLRTNLLYTQTQCQHEHWERLDWAAKFQVNFRQRKIIMYWQVTNQKKNLTLCVEKHYTDPSTQRRGVTEWFQLCSCQALHSNFESVFPLMFHSPDMSPRQSRNSCSGAPCVSTLEAFRNSIECGHSVPDTQSLHKNTGK